MSGLGVSGVVDRELVERAFRELGAELARRRNEAGLTQEKLARPVAYSRSAIANVEVGRQNIARVFWERADEALAADGVLLAGFDRAHALLCRLRAQEYQARQGLAPSGTADVVGLPDSAGSAVTGIAGLTLTVTATANGGLRMVIETVPVEQPAAEIAPGEGAQVVPIVAALAGRAARRSGRDRRPS